MDRNAFRWCLVIPAALALLCLAGAAQGYNIETQFGSVRTPLRGQSFVPSQRALAPNASPTLSFALPQDLAGQAYLKQVAFRIGQATPPPDQIFLFAELPSPEASVSGEGALAVADLLGSCLGDLCRYQFPELVSVNFNQRYFALFSECALILNGSNAGVDDYPAGTPVESADCEAPASSTLTEVPGNADTFFAAEFWNASPNLVADYLAADQGLSREAGAPALTGQDFTQLVGDLVKGRDATVLPMDGVLQLDTNTLVAPNAYSIVLLLRLDETASFRKLLDFSEQQLDFGLYASGGGLQFFNRGTSPTAEFPANTWLQVILQRDLFGRVVGRIDDNIQFQFDDDSDPQATLTPAEKLVFFADDLVTGPAENPSGAWARIQLFENVGAPLSGLQPLPPDGPDAFENDNGPFRADLGLDGAGARFRTLHTTEDEDWLYAGVVCETPTIWNAPGVLGNLMLYSQDPRFQPLVEYYPQGALGNPDLPPEATFGACGQSQRLMLPATSDRFIRIRNCPDVAIEAGDPVRYRVQDISPDFNVCAAGILIEGQVTEAGSGAPVGGVFILGDDNSAGFSKPTDGSYRILVTDFESMTLQVVSPFWQAPSQVLALSEPGSTLTVNFEVSRKDSLFGSSMEETNPFQLP